MYVYIMCVYIYIYRERERDTHICVCLVAFPGTRCPRCQMIIFSSITVLSILYAILLLIMIL